MSKIRNLGILSSLLGLILLVIGCGGSGGGSGTPDPGESVSTLLYRTDWTSRSRAVTGESQRVSLYNSSGMLLHNVTMEATGASPEVAFPNLSAGLYRLVSELYSGPSLTGTVVGLLELRLTVEHDTTIESEIGAEVDSIAVTPNPAKLEVGDKMQFTAVPKAASGKYTFSPLNGIVWSETGGLGTITPAGELQIETSGTGTVVATFGALEGVANVNVGNEDGGHSKWTVLFYMNGANDRQNVAQTVMNRMETKAFRPEDLRVIVQWKQATGVGGSAPSFSGTNRYVVKYDTTNNIASKLVESMGPGIDMGAPQTLNNFINWAKLNYPSDHYILVIWGKGHGWLRTLPDGSYVTDDRSQGRGISYDLASKNVIQSWELDSAIGDHYFDAIVMDADYMMQLEVLYQIRNKAEFFVGSALPMGPAGIPYQHAFQDMLDNINSSPSDMVRYFVDAYRYPGSGPAMLSYSNSHIEDLASAINDLSLELLDISQGGEFNDAEQIPVSYTVLKEVLPAAREATLGYDAEGERQYLNPVDFGRQLYRQLFSKIEENDAKEPDDTTRWPGGERSRIVNLLQAANRVWNTRWHSTITSLPETPALSFYFPPAPGVSHDLDYAKLKFSEDIYWRTFLKYRHRP